jgi:type II secretory pathway pseudopilin PulG
MLKAEQPAKHSMGRNTVIYKTLVLYVNRVRTRVGAPEQGYTLAGALVLIAILSIFMAISVPIWDRIKQRENEEELIFRGNEYVEAIARYHQKYNSYPPDVKTLYEMKFLRHMYKDPMTKSGEWKLLHPDSLVQAGAAGQINQPGAKNPPDQSADTRGDSTNPAANPDSNPLSNSSQGTTDQNLNSNKNDEEEEPEASPDDKEISIGPIVGVVSRSKKSSLLIYNGQSTYNKWVFAYVPQQPQQQQQQPGAKPGSDKGRKKPKPPAQPPTTPGSNNPGANQNNQNEN